MVKTKSTTFGEVDVKTKVNDKHYKNIKGIVFIKNGWGATDHIDVWNGALMKGGSPSYFALGDEVWFWQLG